MNTTQETVEISQFLLRYPLPQAHRAVAKSMAQSDLPAYFNKHKIEYVYATLAGTDHDTMRSKLENYLVSLAKSRWPEYVHPTPL